MPMDPEIFKSALRNWSSGVTIVTTRDQNGAPSGFTASSFTSVSLSPPRILVCLDRDSSVYPAFETASHFAVHILARGQRKISGLFAKGDMEQFSEIDFREGLGGAPLLPGCLATLQCVVADTFSGGDHIIMLGEVKEADCREGEPLLYYQGAYHALAQ